jgi:hypothetical protein
MKVKITWTEFLEAANIGLRQKGITPLGALEFFQQNGYEPDSQCYSFPPAYVEIEVAGMVGSA